MHFTTKISMRGWNIQNDSIFLTKAKRIEYKYFSIRSKRKINAVNSNHFANRIY